MHILLIHQAFAGPDDPGGTRHYELATGLVASGHRVTVVTSAVNYLTGTAREAETVPVPDGMRIVRIPGTANIHRSYRARAQGFVAFGTAALREVLRVKGVDVVWGTSPPLVQLLPAWLASLRCARGLVFEERDLWPEFALAMGVVRDGALARAALAFKRFMYARASAVVVNSPGFVDFVRRHGVAAGKIHVIPNGVDVTQFDPEARGEEWRRQWAAEERFVVLYAGALGPANGLETVIEAAEQLRETRALFVLVGDGKARPQLVQAVAERGLDNVRIVPAQPKRAMPGVVAAADACLATLRDLPLFRTTYPNKVFDYMAAGRAVLLGIDGVIRAVVERAGAGVFVTPGDALALAAGVRRLMEDRCATGAMGRRGRAAVCEQFDRRLQAAQIEALFTALPERSRRSRLVATETAPGGSRPAASRGSAA